MVPESIVRRRSLRESLAKEIAELIAKGGNPIRTHTDKFAEYQKQCRKFRLELKGVNLSIGDIDIKGIAKEQDSENWGEELGIPGTGTYKEIRQKGEELDEKYWGERPLQRYGGFAGVEEVRKLFADFLFTWSGLEIPAENTYFSSNGGSGTTSRDLDAIRMFLSDSNLPVNFLTSVPTYMPIVNMAKRQEGMDVKTVVCKSEDNYFFQPDQIGKLVKDNNIGVFYIVPIGNPTSVVIPSEQLRQVIVEAKKANSSLIYYFDPAYITSLNRKKAHELMGVIVETGILEQSVITTTLSKSHARPGDRLGATHTLIPGLDPYIKQAAQKGNPSASRSAMMEAYGVLNTITIDTIEKIAQVYNKRRRAMVEVLKEINNQTGKKIFANLDQLKADAGLYVFPELSEGITSLDLFVKTGMIGIGGKFFGSPDSNRIRFAIGTLMLEKIQDIPDKLDLVFSNN